VSPPRNEFLFSLAWVIGMFIVFFEFLVFFTGQELSSIIYVKQAQRATRMIERCDLKLTFRRFTAKSAFCVCFVCSLAQQRSELRHLRRRRLRVHVLARRRAQLLAGAQAGVVQRAPEHLPRGFGLHSLPGVRFVTWTIVGVINRCFDCKITGKVPTLPWVGT
jgi:hypothetical protein